MAGAAPGHVASRARIIGLTAMQQLLESMPEALRSMFAAEGPAIAIAAFEPRDLHG